MNPMLAQWLPVMVMLLAIWLGLLYNNKRQDDFKDLLRAEVGASKAELKGELGQTTAELRGELGQTKAELRGEINELRANSARPKRNYGANWARPKRNCMRTSAVANSEFFKQSPI